MIDRDSTSEWVDTVVGRLCLEKGWISQDQLVTCLQKCDGDTTLPDVLISSGILKSEDATRIRKEVSSLFEPSSGTNFDLQIGQILRKGNRVTQEQLDQALAEQKKSPGQRLGEILLQMGAVKVSVLLDALNEQKQTIVLACAKCAQRFSTSGYDPAKKYSCRKCGGTLLLPDPSGSLKSSRHDTVKVDPDEVREAAQQPKNQFGKYVIVKELGRGGMGVVYKAWDSGLKRWSALKLLTAPGDGEERVRFEREAQTAASIRHPNIVGIYEVGEIDGKHYIAMEFIEGRTLAGQKLAPKRAAEILLEVSQAVDFAHSKGIIHRDLKPQNVMLDNDGKAWVMDFGLAKNVRGDSQITMSGTVIGTPSYMPPEQAKGKNNELDRRTDVYSLGALLYDMLTGKPPFKGSNPVATLDMVVNSEVRPPSHLNPSVPPDLETIGLKCLEKEKHRRYPSARLLCEDLERFLRGEGIAARPASLVTRIGRRVGKHKGAFVGFGVAGACVAAVLAVIAVSRVTAERDRSRTLSEAERALARGDYERAEVLFLKIGETKKAQAARDRRAAEAEVDRKKDDDKEAAEKKARADAQPKYDNGRRAVEEADKDLFRTGANLARMRELLEEAVRDFTEAIRIYPRFHEAWVARGQALVLLHRPDEAEADLTRAIEILPNYAAAFLARGRLRLARYMELAEADYRPETHPPEFTAWRDKSIADFRKAQELGSLREEMEFVKANIAYAEDRPDEAIAILTKLIEGGSKKEYYLKLRGDAWRRKALQDRANSREAVQNAFNDYSEALKVCANYYAARRYRGALLFEVNNPAEAEKDFREGLRIHPNDSYALSDMGTYCERMNRDDEALEYFQRAIKENPRNYRAWANLGAVKMKKKDHRGALADIEESLKIHPRYLNARHNQAITLFFLGEETRAIQILGDLIQEAPQVATLYNTRGQLHFRGQRWRDALPDFKKAVELGSRYAATLAPAIAECERRLAGD